jgi:DNA repair protein RecO (recombination protein O)
MFPPLHIAKAVAHLWRSFITTSLTEQQPDEQLYTYLSNVFSHLDQTDHVVNFTIKTLLDIKAT